MHRVILGAAVGVEVDHINHNRLDNRRENLRFASRADNARNVERARGVTGYRGVAIRSGRFHAQLYSKAEGARRKFFLGSFGTAEEAAHAWDAKARELYGEFAVLNFPTEAA